MVSILISSVDLLFIAAVVVGRPVKPVRIRQNNACAFATRMQRLMDRVLVLSIFDDERHWK